MHRGHLCIDVSLSAGAGAQTHGIEGNRLHRRGRALVGLCIGVEAHELLVLGIKHLNRVDFEVCLCGGAVGFCSFAAVAAAWSVGGR